MLGQKTRLSLDPIVVFAWMCPNLETNLQFKCLQNVGFVHFVHHGEFPYDQTTSHRTLPHLDNMDGVCCFACARSLALCVSVVSPILSRLHLCVCGAGFLSIPVFACNCVCVWTQYVAACYACKMSFKFNVRFRISRIWNADQWFVAIIIILILSLYDTQPIELNLNLPHTHTHN